MFWSTLDISKEFLFFNYPIYILPTHQNAAKCYRYKAPPNPGDGPVNFFEVTGSVLTLVDDKKAKATKDQKFGFMIRFMQMTQFVERSFHCDTEEDREEWMEKYKEVQKEVSSQSAAAPKPAADASSAGEEKVYTLADFEMMKVLGKGTFGKVMLSKEKATGDVYAIKVLKKDVILAKDEVTHTLTENAVLQNTKHPFLTGLKYVGPNSFNKCCFYSLTFYLISFFYFWCGLHFADVQTILWPCDVVPLNWFLITYIYICVNIYIYI